MVLACLATYFSMLVICLSTYGSQKFLLLVGFGSDIGKVVVCGRNLSKTCISGFAVDLVSSTSKMFVLLDSGFPSPDSCRGVVGTVFPPTDWFQTQSSFRNWSLISSSSCSWRIRYCHWRSCSNRAIFYSPLYRKLSSVIDKGSKPISIVVDNKSSMFHITITRIAYYSAYMITQSCPRASS